LSDVVLSGQLGVLASIEKRIAARLPLAGTGDLHDGFKDKDGLWTTYMTNVMVSAYNNRAGKKTDCRVAVEDLLRPRWKKNW